MNSRHDTGQRLPVNRRLRPARHPGPDGATWLFRASIAALVLAFAWLGIVALRPLPRPETPPVAELPDVRDVTIDRPSLAQRQSMLDRVQGENHFRLGRLPWTEGETAVAEGEEPETVESIVDRSRPPRQTSMGDIVIDDPETLPDDVRKALTALALRGVRLTPDGEAVAMISKIHSGNQFACEDYVVGDTFTEPKNPQSEWRVEMIDPDRDLVVLHRSGRNVVLSMYEQSFAYAARSARPDPLAGTVERRSRSQVAADLLEADRPTEEIKELLDLIDAPVEPGAAEPPPVDQVAAQPERNAEAEKPTKAPPPSEGMRQLLLMMMSGRSPEEMNRMVADGEASSAEPAAEEREDR